MTVGALAWIGLAAYQLWPVEPPERLLATAAAGALALLVAAAYDLSVARALHRALAESPAPPTSEEVPPVTREIPGLGGHSLRR